MGVNQYMLSERLLSSVVRSCTDRYLNLKPFEGDRLPGPEPGKRYMLYMHVPFCQRLCPYCSFNRFPYSEERARPYYQNLRREMLMLAEMGYDFDSLYVGGGTPTIMIDELCKTIDLARETFSIKEVSSETNPNHLTEPYLEKLEGRVQRLSVGVQSFDNGLLKQMGRLEKYGDADTIRERLKLATPHFKSMNADMIFNFPAQTEDILATDIAYILESGVSQTTFYPLMASPSVEKSLAATVGRVDYSREKRYYDIIAQALTENGFTMSSAWTFDNSNSDMIDEYVVDYEEYPAIGSGGITYLGQRLYVNTFSVKDYNDYIEHGRMSATSYADFDLHSRMRYRFMMNLFGLRLDKQAFKEHFGVSVEAGLPLEMAYMRAAGAFETDNAYELTLTPKGRYLMVAMMRQFFIGVNKLRDQARAKLTGEEHELLFGDGSVYGSVHCAGVC